MKVRCLVAQQMMAGGLGRSDIVKDVVDHAGARNLWRENHIDKFGNGGTIPWHVGNHSSLTLAWT